jgi:hypothetical protein
MNKRIERLETITERLMRRASKRSVGLITPYPISNAVFGEAIKGSVLRYMFPCSGTISKGYIRLGSKPKQYVMLDIKMFNEQKTATKGYAIEKRFLSIEPNLPVSAGDCLEISLDPQDEVITEIWISFLWKPGMKDVEAKSFLIEELENDLLETKKMITE